MEEVAFEGELYKLDHDDLVNLLCGTDPYCASTFLYKMDMGDLLTYNGGLNDYYKWNREAIKRLNEMEIYSLYLSLKAL